MGYTNAFLNAIKTDGRRIFEVKILQDSHELKSGDVFEVILLKKFLNDFDYIACNDSTWPRVNGQILAFPFYSSLFKVL